MACVKDNVHIKTSLCSSVDGTYKENMNLDSSETPKLNVEPQTMKRKKKDGAYDVRKSLAWDRAFLTEEGVLNPVELCMLNEGCDNNSGNDFSPTTDEEGKKISSSFASVSDTTQVTGELPCKLPPPASSYKSKNDGYFSSKHLSCVDMQKILSDRVGSKSGGYSRDLVHSSLKRAGCESSEKIPMKSKIPKIPVPKPGSHLAAKGDKANVLRGSNLKRNQSAQTDIVHGSGTTKVFSANTTSSACKANTSSLISPGRCKADQDLTSSALQAEEVFPTSVLGSDGLRALGSYYQSNGVQCSGRNILYNQGKPLKPSGLRMPSPSLGFFGQPLSSAANHTSQKVIQATNIPERSIPSLQKYKNSNYTCGKVKGKPDVNIVPKVDEKVPSYYYPSSEVLEEKEAILVGNEGIGECLKRKLDGNDAKMCHFFECASEIGCNLVCDDIESSSIDSKLESRSLLVEQSSTVKVGHLNLAEEVSQMENHEGLIDTHFNPDLPSKGRKDLGVCDLATSNSSALPLLNKEVITGAKELMNENFSEEACIEHSSQEIQQENVRICQKLSLVGGSGSNNSSISIQVSQIVLERADMKDVSEHTRLLSPAETTTRREEDGWSSDEAASSVSGMVLTREDQNSGTISSCLNKEEIVRDEGLSLVILKSDGNGVVSQGDNDIPNGELEHELDKSICLTESSSSTKTSEECLDHQRPILTVKPPPHAIPFSDEWLAAMEAAGEGFLALKSGAVQNSPPNKSLPEPSPWSPVKRKSNHVVGPFECTKFTKVGVLPPSP